MGCVPFLNFFQEFARGSCRNGRITLECQIKMVIKVLAGFKFFFFSHRKEENICDIPLCHYKIPSAQLYFAAT